MRTTSGTPILVKANRFRQALDRERAVGVDLLIARLRASCARRPRVLVPNRIRPSVHRSENAIGDCRYIAHCFTSAASCTCDSGSKVRNSKMEIIGQDAYKQPHSRQEHADGAGERHPVPLRGVVHAPRRIQEVAAQTDHNDNEALQPHADQHDERNEPEPSGGDTELLQPQNLRNEDVAGRATRSTRTDTGRAAGSTAGTNRTGCRCTNP